jgi:hypothetical protein
VGFLYPEQLDPFRDHWRFGYETGRVARSLAQGQGFSSPLYDASGPTAWLTPLFPGLLAGVFKVFGIYSNASALVMLFLDCLFSALTGIPVFLLALRSFGLRTAKWAGWLWAFFPYGVYFPAERIWETWLATLLLCLILLLAFHLESSARLGDWAGYGLLWGVAALNSPVALSVLPFLSGWICYRRYRKRLSWFPPAVLSAVVFIAIVAPWLVRTYGTFHQFVPFRDTLGLELYVGNNGDTSHWHPNQAGPWHNDAEYAEYMNLGELAYMANKKHQAMEFISGHPVEFSWLTVRRIVYLWTGFWSFNREYLRQEPLDLANIPVSTTFTVLAFFGLYRAFREKAFGVVPYTIVLLFFPVVYYVTHPEVYYLRPLDPLVAILTASFLTRKKLPETAPGKSVT